MSHRKYPPDDAASTPHVSLTERDREILDTLVRRVRVLSIRQIATHWWPGRESGRRLASRRLAKLESAGWVECYRLMARPELALDGPLVVWAMGQPMPNFDALAYQLRSRWKEPAENTEVVVATAHAGRLLGGYGGRRPRPSEATHDLHMASIYLKVCRKNAMLASTWLSEEFLARQRPKRRGKVPDAMVSHNHHPLIIEFGGAYAAPKLREFHDYCASQNWPYEIW